MTMLEPVGWPSREARPDWAGQQHDGTGPAGDPQREEPAATDLKPEPKKNEKEMQALETPTAASLSAPAQPPDAAATLDTTPEPSHLASPSSVPARRHQPVSTHPSEPNPTTRRPEGPPRPLPEGCSNRPVAAKEGGGCHEAPASAPSWLSSPPSPEK